MNRRGVLIVVGVAIAPVIVIAAACSFPDPPFSADTDGGSTSDSPSPTGDALAPVGANEDVEEGGATADATTAPDSQRIEAGAGCCDCDGDQFKPDGGDAGTCAVPVRDCDDENKFVHPGRDFDNSSQWQTLHQPTFDWNCDGFVTKQYNYDVGKCSTHSKLEGCGNFQGGFEGNPACGVLGHYVTTCAADGNLGNLNCTETLGDDRKQGCR